jgi:hypothetical protein
MSASLIVSFATNGSPNSPANAGASVDFPLAGGPDTTTNSLVALLTARMLATIEPGRQQPATQPPIRDGDRYQPMWTELEALVGGRDARDECLPERSPLLPSDDLRRSIAQVRVPSTLASLIPEPRLGTPEV